MSTLKSAGARSAASAGPRKKKPSKAAPKERGASGVQLGEDTVRSQILLGGALALAEKGAQKLSVEDILAASRISRRTFYRMYSGKDDVLLALYRAGTDALLGACRSAVAEARGPLERFARCVDAHLRNARGFSRLIYILGGEAQRHDSPLFAHRMQVHTELVALMTAGSGRDDDPHVALAARALILALEGLVRFTLQEGDEGRHVSSARLAEIRHVMAELCAAALRA